MSSSRQRKNNKLFKFGLLGIAMFQTTFLLLVYSKTSSVNVIDEFIPSQRLKYGIVYIAGRDPNGAGDFGIIDQLHLSVLSACYTSEKHHQINFVIFVSDLDHKKCASSSHFDDECIYSRVERSCHSVLPHAKFTYAPLDDAILNWWFEHLGIVSFYHHSTWFGYTKLWLPNLLEKNYSNILFVDTDTIWNKPPSVIFNELDHFNSTQVVGASSIMNAHPQSKSFWNRITSGILLMDLQKMNNSINWTSILTNSIVSNRGGLEAGEKIPVTYNRSAHCEDAHWGLFSKPLCLSIPDFDSMVKDCETSRTCWMAREGDQEFFSNIFTNFHPELLYQLPSEHQCIVMHNFKVGGGLVCDNATLMHAPKFEKLLANKKYLTAFSKVLPPKMYESVRLFFRQMDSEMSFLSPPI